MKQRSKFTSSHHRLAALSPFSLRRAFHVSNAFASVSKSPEPFENCFLASAAASRLSGGDKKGLLTAIIEAMVIVIDRQPKTDPRTIHFEHLRSAGSADICRPKALKLSPFNAPTSFNVCMARSRASTFGGDKVLLNTPMTSVQPIPRTERHNCSRGIL